MASMTVFEVIKFASVVEIDLGLFFGDRGIIFAQRLGLKWELFAVRAGWLHYHVSGQILLRNKGNFAKILYLSKIGETAFTISGRFSHNLSKLPDLDETMFRHVFKIALIEPIAVIELGPFLGTLGPILTQNLALSQVWLAIGAWRPH